MPRTLTWLHLSDLHACSRDGWESKPVTDSLVADIKHMAEKHSLRPDVILFTGDAAWGNDPGKAKGRFADQFDIAHEFFENVRKAFHPAVDKRRIYIVPGNHDVDRAHAFDFITTHLDTVPLEKLMNEFRDGGPKLEAYMRRLHDYRAFLTSRGYEHLATDPERLIYADTFNHLEKGEPETDAVRIGIAGFNSAWTCCREEEKAKLRLCGDFQNNTLRTALGDAAIRIALVHHPINWLKGDEDPAMLDTLQEDYHFLLHGHEHKPRVIPLAGKGNPPHHHATISAGAVYDGGKRPKGYNFVRLDLRKGKGQVFLRATPATGRGWAPGGDEKVAPNGIQDIECPCIAPATPATVKGKAPKVSAAKRTKPGTKTEAGAETAAKYEASLRAAIRTKNNFLDLPGITITTEEAKSYDLSVAYVSLSLAATKGGEAQPSRRAEDMLDALPQKTPRLLITGPAGCGKTTLIRWIAVNAATRNLKGLGQLVVSRMGEIIRHDPKVFMGISEGTLNRFGEAWDSGSRLDLSHAKPEELGNADFMRALSQECSWRLKLPLLIRLRDFADGSLPALKDLPGYLAPHLPDPPPGYFADLLKNGRALVLLDGVDEVPPDNRAKLTRDIEAWMTEYPDCHYLVTSRPDAVAPDWLGKLSVDRADVLDLSPDDRSTFVDFWHRSVGKRYRDAGKPDVTETAGPALKKQLAENPTVARLTTNPLLAASICALHLDGKAQLPRNEGEVCNKLCELLLDLRDKHQHLVENHANWIGYEKLDYDPHKKAILSDIACAMIGSIKASLPAKAVDKRIAGILEKYEPLKGLDPVAIRKAFIERSGLLRVGAKEAVEFIHNTFRDFLAGERWVAMGEREVVSHARHACDATMQPVLRFAALRASPASGIADRLVERILSHFGKHSARKGKAHRERTSAHFLLIQIAAAAALSPGLQKKIAKLRNKLLPPSTFPDAEAIAACGEEAIKDLHRSPRHSAKQRAACVRALGKMELQAANPVLDEYLHDTDGIILAELSRYRNPLSFPAVQAQLLKHGNLPHWCPREHIRDLAPLSGLTGLQSLDLVGTPVSDLAPLRALPALRELYYSSSIPGVAIAAFRAARKEQGLPDAKCSQIY